MITAGVVFIHPLDMAQMIANPDAHNVLDIIKRTWYDGFPVLEINGIVYRQTVNVPQVLDTEIV